MYLDTPEKLYEFIQNAKHSPMLAVDTEFIRERSYYPKLCLIQVATETASAIVDPLAIDDLTPLRSLFQDPDIVKIFHAGNQDCAIIYDSIGIVPSPLFDTQYAAAFINAHQRTGLANLVRLYCGTNLDKKDSFTDWLKRPLSAQQIEYALADVAYLPQIYLRMIEELKEMGRLSWLSEEFERMSDEKNYQLNIDQVWHKVRGTQALPPRKLVLIQAMAAWRERVAQEKDFPRRWILSDEQLVEIARREPHSVADLVEIRGVHDKLGERWAHDLIAALKKTQEVPEELWPRHDRGPTNGAGHTMSLELMVALVRLRASEHRVASSMLATRDDLARLIEGQRKDLPILTGWRRDIVGLELLDLLSGRLALHLEDGVLKVSKIGD